MVSFSPLSVVCQGRHALVYDMNTENETWEWVNLNEVMPELPLRINIISLAQFMLLL